MNDVGFPVQTVLDGIDAAAAAGLTPDQGQHGRAPRHQRGGHRAHGALLPRARPHPALHRVHGRRPHQRLAHGRRRAGRARSSPASTPSCRSSRSPPNYPGEVADRWAYRDGGGEVGVIASVTQPFCADCARARLTADGLLYTASLPAPATTCVDRCAPAPLMTELPTQIGAIWRRARRSLLGAAHARHTIRPRLAVVDPGRVEMSRIGG